MMSRKPSLMHVDLQGVATLVTGGGTGIGRAIAKGLARCVASVAVNYSRSKKDAEDTVQDIEEAGGRAVAVRADVTDEEQVKHLIESTSSTFGRLDILMANAGGPTVRCPTQELSDAQWDGDLDLNCKAVLYCVKHAVPRLPDDSSMRGSVFFWEMAELTGRESYRKTSLGIADFMTRSFPWTNARQAAAARDLVYMHRVTGDARYLDTARSIIEVLTHDRLRLAPEHDDHPA